MSIPAVQANSAMRELAEINGANATTARSLCEELFNIIMNDLTRANITSKDLDHKISAIVNSKDNLEAAQEMYIQVYCDEVLKDYNDDKIHKLYAISKHGSKTDQDKHLLDELEQNCRTAEKQIGQIIAGKSRSLIKALAPKIQKLLQEEGLLRMK